jgi:hypothetical protein
VHHGDEDDDGGGAHQGRDQPLFQVIEEFHGISRREKRGSGAAPQAGLLGRFFVDGRDQVLADAAFHLAAPAAGPCATRLALSR